MKDLVFKIHGRGGIDFPTNKRREELWEKFEKTNLFEFLGKSRIDGSNMYKIKEGIIRLGKIQKIQGISPTVMDRLQTILDENESDIERVTIWQ